MYARNRWHSLEHTPCTHSYYRISSDGNKIDLLFDHPDRQETFNAPSGWEWESDKVGIRLVNMRFAPI